MLHIRPDLVLLSEAGDGAARTFKVTGLGGWAWAPREWSGNRGYGVGNPVLAGRERSEVLETVARRSWISCGARRR